jgi:hypothetical protein
MCDLERGIILARLGGESAVEASRRSAWARASASVTATRSLVLRPIKRDDRGDPVIDIATRGFSGQATYGLPNGFIQVNAQALLPHVNTSGRLLRCLI